MHQTIEIVRHNITKKMHNGKNRATHRIASITMQDDHLAKINSVDMPPPFPRT